MALGQLVGPGAGVKSVEPREESSRHHQSIGTRRGLRVMGALCAMACLTILLVLELAVPSVDAGPVLITITATHGIHLLDVPAIGVWLLGMAGCAVAAAA